MSLVKYLATSDGFNDESCRRKRLGQFFTGTALGRVLAALAFAGQASSIIDPMAGSGDLLLACLELGARPKTVGAIEIDPMAHNACRDRLPEATCLLGNAFDPAIIADLPRSEWDLVITNPPYVRYQSMLKAAGGDLKLPGAVTIRTDLMEALEGMTALDKTDLTLFRNMVSGYSGLADTAVPSWILCASMVSIGGRLALVVPEAWLSRDYATVVQYLLLRWFRIEYIVEDEHAVWFDNAQVKTTLLIARRIERRNGAFGWDKSDVFTRVKVSGKAMGSTGPISRSFPEKKNPEVYFATKAKKVLDSGIGFNDEFISAFPSSLVSVSENLRMVCSGQKWFSTVEERTQGFSVMCVPPEPLLAWMGNAKGRQLVPLESIGVSVGQGLRTGANGFFYSTLLACNGVEALIAPNGVPGVREVTVPTSCLWPVVRRQTELPEGFTVRESILAGRLLDLRSLALPEDIEGSGRDAKKFYTPMPIGLATFIRTASLINFGEVDESKHIYQFSAVAPNIRKGNLIKGIPPRYWYMLPDFTSRHLPEILLPRVNGGTPKAWLVADRGVLVDANFVTLNIKREDGPDAYAVLAFLNSSWCRAVLELVGSVMGGGALKIEATHLRRMPVPKFCVEEWEHLSALGHCLANEGEGIENIDRFVASAILGHTASLNATTALSRFVEEGRIRRGNHKNKKEPK